MNCILNNVIFALYWILDAGYWILDTGYWILDFNKVMDILQHFIRISEVA